MHMLTSDPHYPQLTDSGFSLSNTLHYQLPPQQLVEDALRLGQGRLSDTGALVIRTGSFTGRSPKDRFVVKDELTTGAIDWNELNQPLDPAFARRIHQRLVGYLDTRPEIWVRDCLACADPRFQLRIRVVSEQPAIDLFVHNMFLRPPEKEVEGFQPDWQVLVAPGLQLNPDSCGLPAGNAVVIDFSRQLILIAGTGYTGEIKKAVFYVLNYLLPARSEVLSMHCSANMGRAGDTALFFGLSGTGKTTLSADPARVLIGDDEHGWSEEGIFNFEGGCYAKTIDLDPEKEPHIYGAIRRGALVENMGFLKNTQRIDYRDRALTENTRVSYPLDFIPGACQPAVGPHPRNIFFLTCDAYGVLPPIGQLDATQAMYQFISGYTAKVAGTEAGVTEPRATFSACFGAPFLPLHPGRYADMLGEKMNRHGVRVWLVNTGWTGGSFVAGQRIPLPVTRAMVTAALEGKLDGVEKRRDPLFGMAVPVSCPGVPADLLFPREAWKNKELYDVKAAQLAHRFRQNFKRYEAGVEAAVCAAGPGIG